MGKFIKISYLICIFIVGATQSTAQDKNDVKPTRDPRLEKRLSGRSIFYSRPKDTLKGLARLLYGHETWWVKIKEDNRHLKSMAANIALPEGTKIQYRSAKIDSTYTVQSNDWLVRILLWKYGSSAEKWTQLFRNNRNGLNDPNIIHPGDVLSFEDDGTVRNEQTGVVLVAGLKSDGLASDNVENFHAAQRSVARVPASNQLNKTGDVSFQIGVFLTTLFFCFVGFILWAYRFKAQDNEKSERAHSKKRKAESKKKLAASKLNRNKKKKESLSTKKTVDSTPAEPEEHPESHADAPIEEISEPLENKVEFEQASEEDSSDNKDLKVS